MQHTIRAAVVMIALTGFSGLAQQPPPAGTGAGRGGAEGQGRGAQPPGQQPVASISQRPNGTSLGTIRVGAADNNMWFGWRVAVPSTAIKGLTFSEALVRADGHPDRGHERRGLERTDHELRSAQAAGSPAAARRAGRGRLSPA